MQLQSAVCRSAPHQSRIKNGACARLLRGAQAVEALRARERVSRFADKASNGWLHGFSSCGAPAPAPRRRRTWRRRWRPPWR